MLNDEGFGFGSTVDPAAIAQLDLQSAERLLGQQDGEGAIVGMCAGPRLRRIDAHAALVRVVE